MSLEGNYIEKVSNGAKIGTGMYPPSPHPLQMDSWSIIGKARLHHPFHSFSSKIETFTVILMISLLIICSDMIKQDFFAGV